MGTISDKIRVGVLRGGPSYEYEKSLGTGASILENLDREQFEPLDIFISRDGIWHEEGFEKNPERVLRKVDVVFNALHGQYGEDGTVQRILETFAVPYTGSGAIASALSLNKTASKEVFRRHGLKVPYSITINFKDLSREAIYDIYKSLPSPYVVKPNSTGSSIGIYTAYSLPELEEMVVAASGYSPSVIVEEYIAGKDATCGVVDSWRGSDVHALLPIELRDSEEVIPGNFSQIEKDAIMGQALMAHSVLGLKHYSHSDFRISPKRGIYILETNALPKLSKNSLLPKALHAAGAKLSDFLHHIIHLALARK